jgi:hypothetical protein
MKVRVLPSGNTIATCSPLVNATSPAPNLGTRTASPGDHACSFDAAADAS